MFVLCLNDMRSSNIENLQPIVRAETKAQLEEFLRRETVDPYRDGQWGKSYRAGGGPLEWFNPPWASDSHLHFQDVGTEDDWARDARISYQNEIGGIPIL